LDETAHLINFSLLYLNSHGRSSQMVFKLLIANVFIS
jgi:hypothetical protein